MNQQRYFSQEQKNEARKKRTYISFPDNHYSEPYLFAGSQMKRQPSDKNDPLKHQHPHKAVNEGEIEKLNKTKIKTKKTNQLNSRDSTPLLFLPPRLEDRQIKHNHRNEVDMQNEDGLFVESYEQHADTFCEAIEKDYPEDIDNKEVSSANTKTTVIEFFNGKTDPINPWFANESQLEENGWENTLEDDTPIFDAESTVSAMREFVKEHLHTFKESTSLTKQNLDVNDTDSFGKCINEYMHSIDKETTEESSGFYVHEYDENAIPSEEPSAILAETLEVDIWNEESINQDIVSEEKETDWWKEGLQYYSVKTLPTVKLPVLLAVLNVEMDIFETVDLPVPVNKIIKSNWKVHSIFLQVLQPSTKVLIKGMLTADIDYLHDQKNAPLHQHKINIPWEKVMEINWLYPPETSSSQMKEYMFHDRGQSEVQSHYESIKKFSDTIYFDVKKQHSVWTHELLCQNQVWILEFQGTITLLCHLLQSQLINL
jgi:hypothetical protein